MKLLLIPWLLLHLPFSHLSSLFPCGSRQREGTLWGTKGECQSCLKGWRVHAFSGSRVEGGGFYGCSLVFSTLHWNRNQHLGFSPKSSRGFFSFISIWWSCSGAQVSCVLLPLPCLRQTQMSLLLGWRKEDRSLYCKRQDAMHPELPLSKAIVEQVAMEKRLCLSSLCGYLFTLQLLLILPLRCIKKAVAPFYRFPTWMKLPSWVISFPVSSCKSKYSPGCPFGFVWKLVKYSAKRNLDHRIKHVQLNFLFLCSAFAYTVS